MTEGSIGFGSTINGWELPLNIWECYEWELLVSQKLDQSHLAWLAENLGLPTTRAQICSRARSSSGRFFVFSAAKAWITASESKSFALGPEMRSEGLWESLGFRKIRSFYEITWIFGDCLCYEHFANNLYSKKKQQQQQLELKVRSLKTSTETPSFISTSRITL